MAEVVRAGEFAHLWDKVLRARAAVRLQRSLPFSRTAVDARSELLAALEAYVECLGKHGRPVPYALRDELRLQRLARRGR